MREDPESILSVVECYIFQDFASLKLQNPSRTHRYNPSFILTAQSEIVINYNKIMAMWGSLKLAPINYYTERINDLLVLERVAVDACTPTSVLDGDTTELSFLCVHG